LSFTQPSSSTIRVPFIARIIPEAGQQNAEDQTVANVRMSLESATLSAVCVPIAARRRSSSSRRARAWHAQVDALFDAEVRIDRRRLTFARRVISLIEALL
jgi:hypothetical protein